MRFNTYLAIWVASSCIVFENQSIANEKPDASKPIKVFVLAGQSNMEGKAKVSLLEYQAKQEATRDLFKHWRSNDKWIERNDVWIKFLDRKGKLTVGYGSPGCIGPELEFGCVVGDHYAEQVLLIKTAWGGKSLYRDFRSPSAGLPPVEVLDTILADVRKKKSDATMDEVKKPFGASYRAMIDEVNVALANLKKLFPDYAGQGYELAGFVWFQGWNDMINADYGRRPCSKKGGANTSTSGTRSAAITPITILEARRQCSTSAVLSAKLCSNYDVVKSK